MNFLAVFAYCFADKILKISPTRGCVARLDDISLELNERSLVASKPGSGFEGGDEPIGPARARCFALDGEGRSCFLGIEVVDGAGEGVRIISLDHRSRLGIDMHGDLLVNASGPAHCRTEADASQQIVDDAMARAIARVRTICRAGSSAST